MDKILQSLRTISERAQSEFGAHGFEHTLRVYEECARIGSQMHADLDVLLPAAILHDIARSEENHAAVGAERAAHVLREHGFTEDRIKRIQDAIRTHSFSAKLNADSLEAKILSDADKLDAVGAIGIYRAAAYSGEVKRDIGGFEVHFSKKLLRLKELLYTEEARRIAESRTEFMRLYLAQLEAELEGKR